MNTLEKKYLVCFFYWIDGIKSGFGNISYCQKDDKDIYTLEEILNIESFITKENNYSGCVIQNIVPL